MPPTPRRDVSHRALAVGLFVLAGILGVTLVALILVSPPKEYEGPPTPAPTGLPQALPAQTEAPTPSGPSSPPVGSPTPAPTVTPSATATPGPTAKPKPTATPSGGAHTLTVTSPVVSTQSFGPDAGTVSGGATVYIHGTVTHGPSGCPPPGVNVELYPASAGSCSASSQCIVGAASVFCLNAAAGTAQYQLATSLGSSAAAGNWVARATAGEASGHGALSASASTTFTLTSAGSSPATGTTSNAAPGSATPATSNRPLLQRVNEALRAAGSPITATTSGYWQGRVSRGERRSFQALLDAVRWQLQNRTGTYTPRSH